MNLPIQNTASMSSIDFLGIINKFRSEEGEREVRNNDFIARIEDECDDLGAYEIFVRYGKDCKQYKLTNDQMMLIGMRESKAVRKRVLRWVKELENSAPALPDFSNPEVITGLLTTLQDAQGEVKRLNRVCNDLANQLTSGITAPQFAKLLHGVNSQQIQATLIAMGHLKQTNGGALRGIRVMAKGRNSGYFVQRWTDKGDFKAGSAWVTERGAKWLYKLYQNDKLPMLKGWKGSKSPDLFLGDRPQLALVPTKSAEAV